MRNAPGVALRGVKLDTVVGARQHLADGHEEPAGLDPPDRTEKRIAAQEAAPVIAPDIAERGDVDPRLLAEIVRVVARAHPLNLGQGARPEDHQVIRQVAPEIARGIAEAVRMPAAARIEEDTDAFDC